MKKHELSFLLVYVVLNSIYFFIVKVDIFNAFLSILLSSICFRFLFKSFQYISRFLAVVFYFLMLLTSFSGLYFLIAQKTELVPTLVIDIVGSKWHDFYMYLKPILYEITFLLLLFISLSIYLFRKLSKIPLTKQSFLRCLIYFFLGIIPLLGVYSKFFTIAYPYNILSLGYQAYKLGQNPDPFLSQGDKVQEKNPTNITVFMHVGEAVRADHLSINGYFRNTTPFLQKNNVLTLGVSRSFGNSTTVSIPFILTSLSASFNLVDALKEKSINSVFEENKFKTYFVGRAEIYPLKFYLDQAGSDKVILTNIEDDLDSGVKKLFKKYNLTKGSQFIVARNRGSHFDYYTYYKKQFEKYKPVCEKNKSCSGQQLKNVYDNTIFYLDYTIKTIINQLKTLKKPVIYIYASDHGESLGENGFFGHMNASIENRMATILFWVNDAYKKAYPQKYQALINNVKKYKNQLTYNIIWHSLLDGSGFTNKVKGNFPINKELSIFSNQLKPELKKDWYKVNYKRN